MRLLKCRWEGIVCITKLFPFGSDDNRLRSIDYPIWVLGENNRKSGLEMPLSSESVNYGTAVVDGGFGWKGERDTYVDMAMEEPRAWVVSLEADADLRASNTDDVAARGVNKVERPAHALDDVESVAMEMDGVDYAL